MAQKPPEGDRIAKVLARAGIASRREAERMIEAGRVRVNGEIIARAALNVTGKDKIARIYVPKARRKALFTWFHETVCHMSDRKTLAIMNKHYWWPKAGKDCRMVPQVPVLRADQGQAQSHAQHVPRQEAPPPAKPLGHGLLWLGGRRRWT